MIDQEVHRTLEALQKGQTILYPTDTVWGIGCDATNFTAVEKIFEIKQRDSSKSLVILVDSLKMLDQYIAEIPQKAKQLIANSTRPTTIIFENPNSLATNVIANDNTVAIRIVEDDFCNQLIKQFGKPIVSTSANLSGSQTPTSFSEIAPSILEAVDYVVNLHRDKKTDQASRIIKILANNELQILRK